ncbi:alpha/beta hydrolase [Amorphus sp. 3PC139-8]|uniref:alpha/beta hydrolase n=1 Tax=Amorphus sp. 3PC139-8 TaxID=2735676 RepID=UPI00345D998B
MTSVLQWIGPLSVTERALIGIALILLVVSVLIAVTVFFVGARRAAIGWVVILVASVAALLFLPISTAGLTASPNPTRSYADALERFAAHADNAPEPLNPFCESRLLGHGQRTDKVFVLLHGVSSCPQAFVDFAPLLYGRGHNVLVLRLPQHGYADRGTDALRYLTANKLATFADEAVDMATGLGDEVVVVGISTGGTIAGWLAQNRPEVDRAVLAAPFFGLSGFGPKMNLILMRAMLMLPDVSIWKDPVMREKSDKVMPHAYMRQSTRATGEIMRLGFATYREAQEAAPRASEIVVVTNEADTAVSNETTEAFEAVWKAQGAELVTYTFGAEHQLGHELFDPLEPGSNPSLTYPILLQLAETGTVPQAASAPATPD